MDGLIILNKPLNISSHDAVFKVKKILKEKKVGHTGTLDPLASGVLIICVGKATKLSQYLTTDTKKYRAKILLGYSTTTYDLEGDVVEKNNDLSSINEKIVDNTILSFIGKSIQTPPLYSAIKKNGMKLYEYALKNEEVQIPTREIEVFDAKRVSKLDKIDETICFEVDLNVSKGTYIRSIANDFGKKINLPSTLAGLVRTECSGFSIDESASLEDLEKGNFNVISMIDAVKDFPKITGNDIVHKAKNGMKISYHVVKKYYDNLPDLIAVHDNNNLVAIYKLSFSHETNTYYYKADTVWS